MGFAVGQLAGDYEIVDVLGTGGKGNVYRVRNVISNRIEVLKVLLDDVAADEALGERFTNEMSTLAKLDHPNIAQVYTAFRVENQLVMVMEFIEGTTLADMASNGMIPFSDVLNYLTQVLAALSYAHASGVVHRDIKPSNIMMTPNGVAKLMDFRIPKSWEEPLLTRPGTTMSSVSYMSPEQLRGTVGDARSDIYSVGVLLYEFSAGRRPFEADSSHGVLQVQMNTVPKAPLELNPALPPPMNHIVMTALCKEPLRRFQNAAAFQNALEAVRNRPASQRCRTEFPHSTTVKHLDNQVIVTKIIRIFAGSRRHLGRPRSEKQLTRKEQSAR